VICGKIRLTGSVPFTSDSIILLDVFDHFPTFGMLKKLEGGHKRPFLADPHFIGLFCLPVPHAPPQVLFLSISYYFSFKECALVSSASVTFHSHPLCLDFSPFLFLSNSCLFAKIAIKCYCLLEVLPR
jgi:hypothetical protein